MKVASKEDRDNLLAAMQLFTSNAKTITQLSVAALVLPMIFVEHRLLTGNVKASMMASWIAFGLAAVSGVTYECVAAKYVDATLFNYSQNALARQPRIFYWIMATAFALGAVTFTFAGVSALWKTDSASRMAHCVQQCEEAKGTTPKTAP